MFFTRRAAAEVISKMESDHEHNLQTIENSTHIEELRRKENSKVYADAAIAVRNTEWNAREKFDPSFARSEREKYLSANRKLFEDLPREEALKEVTQRIAAKVLPPGSDIRISGTGSRLQVYLSFDMGAVEAGERGSSTEYNTVESLRRGVEALMGRIYRDLFASCGDEGLAEVRLACRHGVTVTDMSTGNSYLEDQVLFETSLDRGRISQAGGWQSSSAESIRGNWRVVKNGFGGITISTQSAPAGWR